MDELNRAGTPAGVLTCDYRSRDVPSSPWQRGGMAQDTFSDPYTQALLRRRLRTIGLIFLVPLTILLARNLAEGSPADGRLLYAVHIGVGLAVAGLTLLLWSRRPLTLSTLRVLELLLFGALGLYFAQLHGEWFQNEAVLRQAVRAAGSAGRDLSFERLAGASSAVRWMILIVMYGTLIPNTGKRSAAVVAVMALTPCLMTLVLGLRDGRAASFLAEALVDQAVLMFIASAIAVFGAQRIHRLEREARAGRRLGQYQLIARLGAGGMGEVYLAEHLLLRRPCAVKLIHPQRAGDPHDLARFEREARATAALTHPNTVQIFDYGRAEDGTFYCAMEYPPGLNLEQLVERHGPLPSARAVYLLRQVCAALREAHAAGLLHRDLKPSNIITCERGGTYDVAKLLDFGLVGNLQRTGGEANLTREGTVAGTPAYMSPEQAAGKECLDPRSDIYSLGATAYFLLTGRPPFPRATPMQTLAAHLLEPVPPLDALQPGIPAALQAVVLRCLEKDPARRYPEIGSLDEALAACQGPHPWTPEQAAAWWHTHADASPMIKPSESRPASADR